MVLPRYLRSVDLVAFVIPVAASLIAVCKRSRKFVVLLTGSAVIERFVGVRVNKPSAIRASCFHHLFSVRGVLPGYLDKSCSNAASFSNSFTAYAKPW